MNKAKFFIGSLLAGALLFVRFFEKKFFDDGLIEFFQHAYLTADLPAVAPSHVLWVDSLRFLLNSILSIAILYLLFKQADLLKFLSLIYVTVYLVTIVIYYYELTHYETGEYILLFYLRRLLIQPLLLLLLLPALLYQRKYFDTKE